METKPKHILKKFLNLSFKIYKPYYFALIFKTLLLATSTLLSAYTISVIIQYLEGGNMNHALIASGVLIGLEITLAILMNFSNRLYEIHRDKMSEAIDQALAKKIMSLPFSCLENPYYIELKKNSQMGVQNMGAIHTLLECFSAIISSVLSVIGLSAIIITFDPILILILAVGIAFNVFLVYRSMKMQVKFYKELLPINFHFGYYLDTMYSDKCCKDFRLYSIFGLIEQKFSTYGQETVKYFKKITIRFSIYESLISTVRYIQMAFIYILVGLKTITEKLSISNFSLTISSAINFSNCITNIIEAGDNYVRSIEYITPMIELMEVEDEACTATKELTSIDTITFDHVDFAYPNTTDLILKDVSFKIEKHEKISIVGLNGAGKTTIVKLLCRLYEPTKGSILVNDIPIQEYEMNSYIGLVSAVFQDFKLFSYSIKENIRPGIDEAEAKSISYDVGIGEKIEQLPKKWDSVMSKSYDEDGVELSGGQQQKIAIARALAKQSQLLILDEPTSALDPLAEAEIYEQFNSLAAGKTAIYISHRMSSSIFCDKILVLDGGSVKDYAPHAVLIQDETSLYYQLFKTQAKNYAL